MESMGVGMISMRLFSVLTVINRDILRIQTLAKVNRTNWSQNPSGMSYALRTNTLRVCGAPWLDCAPGCVRAAKYDKSSWNHLAEEKGGILLVKTFAMKATRNLRGEHA